jgi:Skp family chaperone for outer membrane proteins
MITKKRILLAALAAPAALAFTAPAHAQVAGIAYANPTSVVGNSKAFSAASAQIETTYKASFEQIQQRRKAMSTEIEPMLKQLDTNKDGQLSQEEIRTAQNAKNPIIDRLKAAQEKADQDVAKLGNPARLAELFAIESILRQYEAAQLRVINAKKISVVLSPEVFMYAPDSADISPAITAELDKTSPTVGIQPPANWQPARDTLSIQQQLVQMAQMRAYQQQAAAQSQGTAPAPAGAAPAPAANAKPAEPR